MQQISKARKFPAWLEQWAARYCASRDILRVFRRAAIAPGDNLRDQRAFEVMFEVLRRARRRDREVDEEARTLWTSACGLGRGPITSARNRMIDDAFLSVVDSDDRVRAINELVRDWKLQRSLGAINRRLMADRVSSSGVRKSRQLPLAPGTGRLRKAEVYRILDAILASAETDRKRKKNPERTGLALGKRVEQRLEPLRRATRVRSRPKRGGKGNPIDAE